MSLYSLALSPVRKEFCAWIVKIAYTVSFFTTRLTGVHWSTSQLCHPWNDVPYSWITHKKCFMGLLHCCLPRTRVVSTPPSKKRRGTIQLLQFVEEFSRPPKYRADDRFWPVDLLCSGQTQVGEPKIGEHAQWHYFASVSNETLINRIAVVSTLCASPTRRLLLCLSLQTR
jgi:hypothetical protein